MIKLVSLMGDIMKNSWILLIFIYALLKGSRDGMKKAALKKSSSGEILFFYTLLGFILTIPFSQGAFSLSPLYILFAFLKAGVVCTAWMFSLVALKKMPVSLFGIVDLSRMIFSTCFGVFILGESFTLGKGIGIFLVITGLLLVNIKKESGSNATTIPILVAALLNCFFNALSGTMDKVLMQYMEASQLQFWYMLFMTLIYGAVLLIRKEKISVKNLKTNYWIPIMSISLVIGDRILFVANAHPLSEVTVMTVIKQASVIVTVLTGWLAFKEKHILYKIMCTLIVLAGIFIAVFL
ncbi:MAG: DMT family transporter [Ruminococcaceae bacterium]|nr:DMT family transporter [Oscillospiraceae bacterium]